MKTNLIFTMLALIVLGSCNCVETHLTKEEREWFNSYEKGQNIIFKSNRGNLDTIVIEEKLETYGNKECNWFQIGSIQNNMINVVLKPKTCRTEFYCDGGISIDKDHLDEKCFPGFRLFGLMYSKSYQENNPLQVKIKLMINDKIYPSAYCFEDGINANNFGNNYLKSFCWDKKEGLIKYETHDGEVFELLKKVN